MTDKERAREIAASAWSAPPASSMIRNPPLLEDLIAAALAAARSEGEHAGMEKAADWHAEQMDLAADLEQHHRAQAHSDSEDYFRSLIPQEPPAPPAREGRGSGHEKSRRGMPGRLSRLDAGG